MNPDSVWVVAACFHLPKISTQMSLPKEFINVNKEFARCPDLVNFIESEDAKVNYIFECTLREGLVFRGKPALRA